MHTTENTNGGKEKCLDAEGGVYISCDIYAPLSTMY
jgi:hypothetical protein